MRRLLLIALLAAACKKEAPAAAGKPAPADVPLAAPPAAPASGKVAVDDALVARFVTFEKGYLAGLPPRLRAMRDSLQALEKAEKLEGPAASASKSAQAAGDLMEQMKAEDKRQRDAAGLSEEQAQAMGDLMMSLGAAQQPGGSPTARDRMMAAIRQKHGDAAVEVALRHQDELLPLWKQQMQIFQDAMKLMTRQ